MYNRILGLKSKENLPFSLQGWSFSGTSGNHIAGTLAGREKEGHVLRG